MAAEVADLLYIKQMLVQLSEKQDSMNDRLNDIDTHLTKISTTVIGDEKFGHKGLVSQVAKLNKYVDNDKIRNAKIVGGLGVVGMLWTIFLKWFASK
jgi:hypothetical protein